MGNYDRNFVHGESCTFCKKSFASGMQLAKHMVRRHANHVLQSTPSKKEHKKKPSFMNCHKCDFWSSSTTKMQTHIIQHATQSEPKKTYKCKKCSYSTAYKDNYIKHKETEHESRVETRKSEMISRIDGSTEKAAKNTVENEASTVGELVLNARNMVPTAEKMTSTAKRMAPTAEKMSLIARNVASSASNMAPSAENMTPTARNVAPTADKMAPTSRNMASTARNMAPRAAKMAPTARYMAPSPKKKAPTVKKKTTTKKKIAQPKNKWYRDTNPTHPLILRGSAIKKELNQKQVEHSITSINDNDDNALNNAVAISLSNSVNNRASINVDSPNVSSANEELLLEQTLTLRKSPVKVVKTPTIIPILKRSDKNTPTKNVVQSTESGQLKANSSKNGSAAKELEPINSAQKSERSKRKLTCYVCDLLFDDLDSLKSHFDSSHKEKTCEKCKMRFSTPKLLQQHNELRHKDRVKCPTCQATFSSQFWLRTHQNRAHQVDSPIVREVKKGQNLGDKRKTMDSPILGDPKAKKMRTGNLEKNEAFEKEIQGKSSQKTVPSEKKLPNVFNNEEDVGEETVPNFANNEEGQMKNCNKCGLHFTSNDILKAHNIGTHLDKEKKFACGICGEIGFGHWRSHNQEKHPKETLHKCPGCDFKTLTRFNWMKHMDNQHGEENIAENQIRVLTKFACNQCKFEGNSKSETLKHIQENHKVKLEKNVVTINMNNRVTQDVVDISSEDEDNVVLA